MLNSLKNQFIREFLPLLRYLRLEPDLLIVTADKGRSYACEQLLKQHRAIHKLGLGELRNRIKPYSVKPPMPSIAGLTWPRGDSPDDLPEVSRDQELSQSHCKQKHACDLIYD
jgi:hypothetical protein